MAARRWSLAVPIVAVLFIAAPFVVPSWILFILHLALAKFLVVLAVALFLRGGLVSFGHALFYAVGAYTAGFAAKWFGVREALLLVPLGVLFGAAVAAVVGLFMAKYRGVFFAMLNLAVSMILYAILLKFYWVTGGTDGLRVQTPTLLGFVPPRDLIRMTSYYVTLVTAGVVTYVVYRFLASPLGYYLKALADNEIHIEYSGESVQRVIYATYVLSGALGGLGGGLAAFTVGHIVPEYAFWIQAGEFVFVALLGGVRQCTWAADRSYCLRVHSYVCQQVCALCLANDPGHYYATHYSLTTWRAVGHGIGVPCLASAICLRT